MVNWPFTSSTVEIVYGLIKCCTCFKAKKGYPKTANVGLRSTECQ